MFESTTTNAAEIGERSNKIETCNALQSSPFKQQQEEENNVTIKEFNSSDLVSYTERADGSPQVLVYRKVEETHSSTSARNLISRSSSPMNIKLIAQMLNDSTISQNSAPPSRSIRRRRAEAEGVFPTPVEIER